MSCLQKGDRHDLSWVSVAELKNLIRVLEVTLGLANRNTIDLTVLMLALWFQQRGEMLPSRCIRLGYRKVWNLTKK